MAKANPEKYLFVYDEPVAVMVAGIQGRAPLATLKGAVGVFDDYTKRTRKGLTKAIGARFRVGAHVFGDLSRADDETEVSFIVGVPIDLARPGTPVELSLGHVREALIVIGRRWLTLDAFEDAGLEVESDYEGWLIAAGPRASARIVLGSATAKKTAATATHQKPGALDAQKHAFESCFMMASSK